MQKYKIKYIGLIGNDYNFSYGSDKNINISFPSESICRFRIYSKNPCQSIMVENGFIKEIINDTKSYISNSGYTYKLTCSELEIILAKDGSYLKVIDKNGNHLLSGNILAESNSDAESTLRFDKTEEEKFYGFGFQRKTLGANGHILTFKKDYRWNEATVPYFLSSSGYGFFSANTFDHTFNFTKKKSYTVKMSGGDIDFFIIKGPDYKKIINGYTALTGRPHMVPAWSFGLCYVARLFEDQKGLLDIAQKFRNEQIPCDMLGLEPGWEKHYYQMKWIWNNDMFPNPKSMINQLHDMGYSFELWESGDAPTSGYMNPHSRKQWFKERIDSTLSIGVDFFKQDDPYPRCITSEEMVSHPSVDVFIEDDGKYSEKETKNIANTLYSATVFEEMRRLTKKRAFIIFHSYGASTSSQMYPCAWAGDFNLGNGALNASLSGHSMVTQDMRSEVPSGIHFGFMMPFIFMDSWAYYLEPWLFSDHIKEMVRFYSRLRVSLFPYLYNSMWASHTTGLPILRPMLLEFQNDPVSQELTEQYMLGDSFLVGINPNRGSKIYLPSGKWIDYWNRTTIQSNGEYYPCKWPSHVGGPLFIKADSIVSMMNSSDSITLNNREFLLLDIYPDKEASVEVYEDDGITYDYEKDICSITSYKCSTTKNELIIQLDTPNGKYAETTSGKATLIKVFLENKPDKITVGSCELVDFDSLDFLIYSFKSGWFYQDDSNSLFIKCSKLWKFSEELTDIDSFYNAKLSWTEKPVIKNIEIVVCKSMDVNKKAQIPVSKITDKEEAISIPEHEFNVVVNPPKRVRLNHGDDWLPYYAYISYEIVKNGKRDYSVNSDVSLIFSHCDSNDVDKTYSVTSYEGAGHFPKIIVSSALKPPNVTFTLSAKGVQPKTIRYNLT